MTTSRLRLGLWLLAVGSLEARPLGRQLADTDACNLLALVPRADWGAREPNEESGRLFEAPPSRVFVHQAWDGRSCAEPDSCSVRLRAIQAYHQLVKGWPDIGYSFLVAADGTVYEGTGFHRQGFHTLNYNQESLGVALIGTFEAARPSRRMAAALERLLDCAARSGLLQPDYSLHGHRDARCTICPGEAAYSHLTGLAHFRPGPLERYSCPSNQTGGGRALAGAGLSRRARQAPAERAAIKRADQKVLVAQATLQVGAEQQQQQQQLYLLTKSKSFQKNNLLLLRPATLVSLASPQSHAHQPSSGGGGGQEESSAGGDSKRTPAKDEGAKGGDKEAGGEAPPKADGPKADGPKPAGAEDGG